jgi:hypothetical protein
MNIQSLIVVVLRLTALNFLVRIIVELTTPLLVFAGIYQRSGEDASMIIGWVLVASLIFGGILLWVVALPVARLVARGVPNELSLGDLSLADCYSIAFMGVGLVYIVSHLAGVWNWTSFLIQWTLHGPRYPSYDHTRGYEIANVFIPFIVGIILLLKRRKWAVALAGKNSEGPLISLNEPWSNAKKKTPETITISISPPSK